MALLYPWATKEYLLWEMTIGQIILYHSKGIDMKYGTGKKNSNAPTLLDKSEDELRALREEAKAQAERDKEEMRRKYGDI